MTKNISSNGHLWMVGENAKMLCKQIEEKEGKITSDRLLSAGEETEFFWTPTKMRGLELTDIQIFVAPQRRGSALLGCRRDTPTSEGGEGTLYSGSGIGEIHDGKVSKSEAIYFQTKEHIRREH